MKYTKAILLFTAIFYFLEHGALAQNQTYFFSHQQIKPFQNALIEKDSNYPSGFKSLPMFYEIDTTSNLDFGFAKSSRKTWFGRKLFDENFVEIKDKDVKITIDPLLNLQAAAAQNTAGALSNIYTNTRGIMAKGEIGKRLKFVSSFYENQGFFPEYLDNFIQINQVYPGNGRVKNFKQNGWDFAMASALVDIEASENLKITFGHGNQFLGEGYRSMLLSDNTFNMPFFRLQSSFFQKKIHLQNSYALLNSLDRLPATQSSEALFQRKLATFHYLYFQPNSNFHFGVFESVMWRRWNGNGNDDLNPLFLNPALGVNHLLLDEADSMQHIITGFNSYVRLKGFLVFGQALIDANQAGIGAYQFGARYSFIQNDMAIFVHLEYNVSKVNTYTYGNSMLSFSHYNQPLAHPTGTDFDELVGMFGINWRRFQGRFTGIYGNNNLWLYSNEISQSVVHRQEGLYTVQTTKNVRKMHLDANVAYVINPNTNLSFKIGLISREELGLDQRLLVMPYLSLSTSISNTYLDF